MMSVVCLYSNENILNSYLLNSLQKQNKEYQLILLDNTEHKYRTAAQALNGGGLKATGKYILFAHQDVALISKNWLADVEKTLNHLDKLGVVGVAGRSEKYRNIVSNLKHGNPPRYAGKIRLKSPIPVQTLDGCLIITPREVFMKKLFDEKTCDEWYLYAVDYCLEMKRLGLKVLVLPNKVFHLSSGPAKSKYLKTAEKVYRKYRGEYKVIYTTVGIWDRSYFKK